VVVPVAQAYDTQNVTHETLRERAVKIAEEFQISTTTLFNLVTQESQWDPNAEGDDGEAQGLVQIHYKLWGMTKEQARDPEIALKFASEKISEGKAYIFTSCSCIQSARLFGVKIPPKTDADDLKPNIPLTSLKKGDLILLRYGVVSHVAVFQEFTNDGYEVKEGNKEPCKITSRIIPFNDKNIIGFWAPKG